MSGSEQIALNGFEVWAYVVELDGGLRMRLDLSDWERVGLYRGQRIPIRRHGRKDDWLFVTHVTELPPMAWVMLANRVRAGV
jgi:hypothetical protein